MSASTSGADPTLQQATTPEASQPRQAGATWGDRVEEVSAFSRPSALQELFPNACVGEEVGDDEEGDDDDSVSELLTANTAETAGSDEEDALAVPLTQRSRAPSSGGEATAKSSEVDTLEVCRRAAVRLNIPWPAPQGAQGIRRDLYDGKRLPLRQAQKKATLPIVPSWLKVISDQ